MPTLSIQATEMKTAKVERISLVPRGANRIPIRIIKEDAAMSKRDAFSSLDLAKVFKREQKPVVTAVIALKGEDHEAVKAKIAEAGFAVAKADEDKDGTVLFAQGDHAVAEGDVVIKMSPTVAVAMKGFRPYSCDMDMGESGSFADACVAQGFYPGVSTMVDVLRSSVYEAVSKADDPKTAAESVSKMFDEVKAYAVGLVQALPSKAFKLEAIGPGEDDADEGDGADSATSEAKKDEAKPETTAKADDKTSEQTGDDKGEVKTDEAKPETTAKADDKDGKKDEPTADNKPETKPEAAPVLKSEEVQGMLDKAFAGFATKLQETLAPVQKAVDETKKSLDGLTARVEQVEGVAKAAKEAVEGTVLSGDAGDDATSTQNGSQRAFKGGEIDTAYTPRQRNRGAR